MWSSHCPEFCISDFGRLCSHSSFAAPPIQHLAFGFLVLNGFGPFRARRPGSADFCLVMMIGWAVLTWSNATKVVMMMLIGYDTIMYQSAWWLVFKHGHAKPSKKIGKRPLWYVPVLPPLYKCTITINSMVFAVSQVSNSVSPLLDMYV